MSRSLPEWLAYIEVLHDRAWDPGLDRVGEVGRRLNVLHPGKHTILVAGTNGKGSTCEYIERLALKQGLTTGKTTSPHLRRFNERIVINGVAVSDEEICQAFAMIEASRREISLSYFEFSTLAALVLFQQHKVDLAILEVGLGGRLDAMNIVNPDISIIMRIALDHQSWLGESVELIGREKAGIMRRGVPCVLGEEEMPQSVIDAAEALHTPLFQRGDAFGITEKSIYFAALDGTLRLENPPAGQLPLSSFLAAVQALFCLNYPLTLEDILDVRKQVSLPGRFQVERQTTTLLFDVAHNPDAVNRLAAKIRETFPHGYCHAVFAVYKDKDYQTMIDAMRSVVDVWYLPDIGEDRALEPLAIRETLNQLGESDVGTYGKVSEACAAARKNALAGSDADCAKDDVVLVFGTFPLVAEALSFFEIPIEGINEHDRSLAVGN